MTVNELQIEKNLAPNEDRQQGRRTPQGHDGEGSENDREVKDDDQMRRNAAFLKEKFLDRGLQGMMGGKGFYEYPNPAYEAPDFLDVPDISAVPDLVERATLD